MRLRILLAVFLSTVVVSALAFSQNSSPKVTIPPGATEALAAFDDKTNAEEAKVNHTEAALLAIAAGKAVEKAETIARGCQIRFNRDGK